MKELLFLLHELWGPDCPIRTIVGDAAWDEDAMVEVCELNYGIHPVFVRKPSGRKRQTLLMWEDRGGDRISGYDGAGVTVCRAHAKPMGFAAFQKDSRDGLEPGDESNAGKFRVRFQCGQGCGSPIIPFVNTTKRSDAPTTHWSTFPYYPHHPLGMPERYAMRLVLQARRNTIESLFGSLKTVNQLGLKGTHRTRLRDFDSVAALIGLALMSKTALLVAAERDKRGIGPAAPEPPKPLSVLTGQRTLL